MFRIVGVLVLGVVFSGTGEAGRLGKLVSRAKPWLAQKAGTIAVATMVATSPLVADVDQSLPAQESQSQHTVWASSQNIPTLWNDTQFPSLRKTQYGKLTRFWAQEQIGAPEAHAFIEELEQAGFSFTPPVIGVIDVGFNIDSVLEAGVNLTPALHKYLTAVSQLGSSIGEEMSDHNVLVGVLPEKLRTALMSVKDAQSQKSVPAETEPAEPDDEDVGESHGNSVVNLIAGRSPVGISGRGEIGLMLPVPVVSFAGRAEIYELIATEFYSPPDLISHQLKFGMDMDESERLAEVVTQLVSSTIFVSSAGNNFPRPIEPARSENSNQMILVGSSDPSGCTSIFSSTANGAIVCAPSDFDLQTIGVNPNLVVKFGGTSGAAPLVSGALADTLSIVPDLTTSEARHLLLKTAIPSSSTAGKPILNYYKLLRVAKRLADLGWPEQRAEIYNDRLYDFRAEAHILMADTLLSQTLAEGFHKLRKAFFLDHERHQVRDALAQVYRRYGYETQALFYDNPSDSQKHEHVKNKTALRKFLVALRDADIETMRWLTPELDKSMFHDSTTQIFTAIKEIPNERISPVIQFLYDAKIAELKVARSEGKQMVAIKKFP